VSCLGAEETTWPVLRCSLFGEQIDVGKWWELRECWVMLLLLYETSRTPDSDGIL